VIDCSPIEERSFNRWRMGFKCLYASDLLAHPAYAALVTGDFDAAGIGAKKGVALTPVKQFASRQRD
jgi:hypothetical protein